MEFQELLIDGERLSIKDVVTFSRNKNHMYKFKVSEFTINKIKMCRELKQDIIRKKQPIYGVTTGFGDSASRQISPEKTKSLQQNLIRFLSCGVGPVADKEVAKATMLIRTNCLIKGNSAVRMELIHQLLEYMKRDIIPLIPERGSVGASGDLVPLSYLASILIGEGNVYYKGKERNIQDVLIEENIEALTLEAKEGLALVNGTSFMSAFACLAYSDAEEIAYLADICTAMASEALLGNRGHFYAFIHEQKPHLGQIRSAQNIYNLLENSGLSKEYSQILNENQNLDEKTYLELTQSIQDRYSLRCAPHVTGVLYDTLDWVKKWLEVEINSTNDNPIFDLQTREIYNGGNFYGGHVVQAMDTLKVAVANIADLLERQLGLIVDEKFNKNLSPNLIQRSGEQSSESGVHHGFKGIQIACSSLVAEVLKMSNPVSVFSRSTEAHNQDKVSMGTIAARDARTMIELTQHVIAMHLLTLCQALDLRGIDKMSPKTKTVYQWIRKEISFVKFDRKMDDEIQKVVQMIKAGELTRLMKN
ncbi:aromatic amino acid ammonia-lyase [Bacillus thuringiensis]|uniref:aromatic amino acid ammonia-lyase n=1 Tax=Bacillus thuringiensis TaxID=1428 RepID=UPI000E55226C|nr:aromatic amino acid ammonia-lyase [Bacillus thuringiensis]MDZ3952298.1 aromatic amino acid ammonia-lyase [Bacillus thuringiensis]RGP53424.1 histidine ammonia-lyase [Bacillus thuringiensis]